MASFRKRLASFFGVKKAAGGAETRLTPGATSEIPSKAPTAVDLKTKVDFSNRPLQIENSGAPAAPISGFESSELLLEIKANSVIAKAPWSGKLASFQTNAWDHKSAEIGLFPAGAMEELNEAYVYIRLANRLVWLSEDLGRSSQDITENYLKMCKNVAERLDKATSLLTAGTEQTQKPEKTALKQADQVQKPEAVIEKAQKTEATAVKKTEANQKSQKAAVEKAEQKQRANKLEGRKAAEPAVKKADKGKVAANRSGKNGVDEEYDQLFQGITTLYIAQDAQVAQISALLNLIGETQEIKVLSSGGAAGQRSWVIVSSEKPLPLMQVLRKIPMVKKITRQGKSIEVSLTAT